MSKLLTPEEIEAITTAAYTGGKDRSPQADVYKLLGHIDELALDAERYRKWVSYSGFTKEKCDATLDAIKQNEHAAKEPK